MLNGPHHQAPMIFDLIDDPTEEWDIMATGLDCGWVIASAFQRLGAFMKSAAEYPSIKPGQDLRVPVDRFPGMRQGSPEIVG